MGDGRHCQENRYAFGVRHSGVSKGGIREGLT